MSNHQVFSIEYDSIARAIVSKCHISHPFDPERIDPTTVEHYRFTAIWDTGATNTVITQNVIDKINLAPTGVTKVRGVGGEHTSNKYLINLVLPNHVGLPAIPVTQGDLGNSADVLIGMDVISRGDFAVTNNKNTVLSFRMPSFETIKFKSDPTIKKKYNFNRNDKLKVKNKETGEVMVRKWKNVEQLVKNGQYKIVQEG